MSKSIPEYVRYQRIRAFRIKTIQPAINGRLLVVPEDSSLDPVEVPYSWLSQHRPKPGSYYVQFEDGHSMYMDSQNFERNYVTAAAFAAYAQAHGPIT